MPDSVNATAALADTTARSGEDRRACRLENVRLTAKIFVPVTEIELGCIVTDLSADGASIITSEASSIGSEIALYVEGFDRFSAAIVSATQDGIRVKFNCSQNKRARTAEKIFCYLDGNPLPQTNLRNAQRSAFHSVRDFRRQNGEIANFDVIDISLSGASLRTKCRPAIDEIIAIGTIESRVARHFDDGIAVEFTRRSPSGPGSPR